MCEPSMSARPAPPGRRPDKWLPGRSPRRLPSGSRWVLRPASRIHPSTSARASSRAGVAKRRVRRPGSSLQRARRSQRSSTVRASDMRRDDAAARGVARAPPPSRGTARIGRVRCRRMALSARHATLSIAEVDAMDSETFVAALGSADELASLTTLNADYRARFGFPFIACVREHSVESLLAWGRARLAREPDEEAATALAEVGKIVGLRLCELVADR